MSSKLSLASIALTLLFTSSALALPALQQRSSYPFNQLVAFGDEFSDNGNGSYAHGITGSPATVYGYGTWTNGPVAVSYLADLLSVPLRDLAFGGCCGGSSFGATLDSSYTASPANAPSLVDQLANYTGHAHPNVKNALEVIWVGQNDLSKHTDAFWLGDSANSQFATNFSIKTAAAVKTLLNAGAPYVLVANIYPKHLAPVTKAYLCGTNTDCVTTWGQVIQEANAALKTELATFGTKVIYYDVYTFMTGLLNSAVANGFTQPLTYYCDGDSNSKWKDCMEDGHASQYFWMNFEQPTARVHQVCLEMCKVRNSLLTLWV